MRRKSSIFPTHSAPKTAMFQASYQHNHLCADQLCQKCLFLVAVIFSLGDSDNIPHSCQKGDVESTLHSERHNLVSSKQSAGESHPAQNMRAFYKSLSKNIKKD